MSEKNIYGLKKNRTIFEEVISISREPLINFIYLISSTNNIFIWYNAFLIYNRPENKDKIAYKIYTFSVGVLPMCVYFI